MPPPARSADLFRRDIRTRARCWRSRAANRLFPPRPRPRRFLSFREALEPGVDVGGGVHLAAAVYGPVGRQRLLHELARALLPRGVAFDRLQHEAVRGTPAPFCERRDARSELGRKLEGGGGGHIGSKAMSSTMVAPRACLGKERPGSLSSARVGRLRFDQKILSRGDRPGRFRLVLEVDSGELAPSRLAHEVVELVRGELAAHAFAPYVGDAVALSVGGADPGIVGQVDAHAVGGAQARTLADQYGHYPGAEDLTDLVAHGHPALFDDRHGRNAPPIVIELPQRRVEERHGVLFDGKSGEPIGDDESRVESFLRAARSFFEPSTRFPVQPAALVGTL